MPTPPRTTLIATVLTGFLLSPATPLLSGTIEGGPDSASVLPAPVGPNLFTDLREHSPFTRVLDFSESIRLTGVAMIDGEQVATVHDREKGKSYVISGEPNKEGWKMVEVESNADLANVSATISVAGGELVTVQFDAEQLHPEQRAAIKATNASKGKPPPSDEEKRKFGEFVRGRMSKMSEQQRKRVGQIMQEKMKANPKLSDRQKGEIFVKILDYVDSGKK